MEFFLKYVCNNEKSFVGKNNKDKLVLDSEVVNALNEQKNYPIQLPRSINLSDVVNYVNLKWKGYTL